MFYFLAVRFERKGGRKAKEEQLRRIPKTRLLFTSYRDILNVSLVLTFFSRVRPQKALKM